MKLRSKSIMTLIYCALLSIPLVSILSRVIYVQSNKNAYQSYSETSALTTTLISDNAQVINGNNYMINLLESGSSYSENIFINSSTIDYDYLANTELSYDVIGLRFYPNNTHIRFIESNLSSHNYVLNDEQRTYLNGQTFNLQSGNLVSPNQPVRFYMVSYSSGKLDNVFEYSINKLVDDNNFGQLNFFEWFSGFLLNDAQQNNLYIHFANWYMCYAMLISLMQILFLCLMWFVNFSRKVLDKGMNYDW